MKSIPAARLLFCYYDSKGYIATGSLKGYGFMHDMLPIFLIVDTLRL